VQRKLDHLGLALTQPREPGAFVDFHLIHNCLPGLDIREVDLRVDLLGVHWKAPVYINAMTGGHAQSTSLNVVLGAIAARYGLPVAVGSQRAALLDPALCSTFTAIRSRNPDGQVWANLSAGSSLEHMRSAVQMINANALQLHLNAAQELVQPEGDRNFQGWLENITAASALLDVPIVVKEVGFGIAKSEASALAGAGVSAIDCSGRGGTDFLRIEQQRYGTSIAPLAGVNWGIPTPLAVAESVSGAGDVPVFASGGIDAALQAVICLALGAKAVGLGQALLSAIHEGGEEGGMAFVDRFLEDLMLLCALQGVRSVQELEKRPLVVTGQSAQWIAARKL
jgi:isopentenyl-diphosphate delta-isomerase